MRWLLCCLMVLPIVTLSQKTCETAKVIGVDNLTTITSFPSEVVYFKIRKDSVQRSIRFSGAYLNIIIQPSECISGTSFILDSFGLVIPSEEMINAGICYCGSCIKRYSEFSLKNDLVFKIEGGKRLTIRSEKPEQLKELAWYEKQLKSGDKIRLNNILFIGGQAKFRSVSFKDLNRLFDVLERNPSVKVEIQGHVNSPGKRNNKVNQNLSDARAKAVMGFLIKKGISSERLAAVGYGNTQMIYPKAKNEYEMQFNRRVEILVK